jgi:hypothetical protein
MTLSLKALTTGTLAGMALTAMISAASASGAAGRQNEVPAAGAATLRVPAQFERPFGQRKPCIGINCVELGGGRVFQEDPVPAYKPGYIYRDSTIPTYRRVTPPQRGGILRDHIRWCAERYRSYRASDNSYKPLDGQRRECLSPFS